MKRANSKLIEAEVRGIHIHRKEGWTYPMLCKEYGISNTQVQRILSGMQWREIWLEYHDPDKLAAEKRMAEMPEPSSEELADFERMAREAMEKFGKP